MDPTLATVTQIVRRVLPEERAAELSSPDSELHTLRLGSLELVSLLVALEDTFSVRFPADAMHRDTFESVRTITEALRATLRTEGPDAGTR
ncbi:phosphopantetheine-binding protein [Streptomyces fagopyri]|uniref:Acyl carrier protein n=1 Tax=Streptomyces fagopyri TaxID=2662397 RepID=A0A5Q0L6U6_9ACTN|nr:phosphopantetheine-binding protein [Streptomyces fagopyri]QFZ72339.1 acyl carrier protein [Streptomyces fagopyri]